MNPSGLNRVAIPTLVRIKPGAVDRVGIYAARYGYLRVSLLISSDLPQALADAARASIGACSVEIITDALISQASFEAATDLVSGGSLGDVVIGLGGGRAIDVAKYVAHLAGIPFFAMPTSLSNDGFASPMASLTLRGRRRSLPATPPAAVIIDTDVCSAAPLALWWSGVGDLVAKLTAVADWKLSFHDRSRRRR